MDRDEKLAFFLEMLQCTGPISYLVYDQYGELLNISESTHAIHRLFSLSGCLSYAREWALSTPLCLGSALGTLWGVVFTGEGSDRLIHVIGPTQNSEISREALEETLRQNLISQQQRRSFIEFFSAFPIIPITLLQQYILMLHLCLNDEKLRIADIHHQSNSDIVEVSLKKMSSSRYINYEVEKKLLFHVREGDLNYKETSEFASIIGKGYNIKTKDPLLQLIISVTSFTTLCIRAAIEGGLPPDTAHTLGTAYVQSMTACKNISELGALNNAMYSDFVQRVHDVRNSNIKSPQIRACCEYIQLHPEEHLSISSLAKLTGYTDYYLSRKFKAEIGQSLRQYIDSVRVNRAKVLLETTSMSILEISRKLQFCSGTHFSSIFRNHTGLLPRDYRQEKLNGKRSSPDQG